MKHPESTRNIIIYFLILCIVGVFIFYYASGVINNTVIATITPLSATIEANSQRTITAQERTIAAQQAISIKKTVTALRPSEIARIETAVTGNLELTQTSVQATEVIRDEISHNVAVAMAVHQTIVAIPPPTVILTPTAPKINILIQGCALTGEVLRRTFEVTNAYITVQNIGNVDISAVNVYITASDQGEYSHPDRIKYLQYLPAGKEVTLLLTTDTRIGVPTSIESVVVASNGVYEHNSRSDCEEIDQNTLEQMASILGKIINIGRFRWR